MKRDRSGLQSHCGLQSVESVQVRMMVHGLLVHSFLQTTPSRHPTLRLLNIEEILPSLLVELTHPRNCSFMIVFNRMRLSMHRISVGHAEPPTFLAPSALLGCATWSTVSFSSTCMSLIALELSKKCQGVSRSLALGDSSFLPQLHERLNRWLVSGIEFDCLPQHLLGAFEILAALPE